MARYVTANDVKSAVTRDPYGGGSTAALPDDQLLSAVDDAQAEVDGWLRQRYTVPFTTVPALVRSVTVDIAAYLATLTYYQETEILDNDPIPRRYMRARALLKDIAEGRVDLDVADGAVVSTGSGFGQPINPCGSGLLTADMDACFGARWGYW